jgi:2-keto-4-pentenoate hydratase/2-oxohepta-3-ene-1,7-dioic acid hydratase in catechol pathway
MRLVTFEIDSPLGPLQRLGCIRPEGIVDVNLAYRDLLASRSGGTPRAAWIADALVPANMLDFIETGELAEVALREAVDYATGSLGRNARTGAQMLWDQDEVRLLAPLPTPRSLREFGQFLGHATKGGRRALADVWYEAPHYWKGNPSTIVGPEAVIRWPSGVERLDFELEIACVIGRAGLDLEEAEALDHVAGFTLFNDICARDLQVRELPAGKGPSKSHDFCSVMGPELVTLDELDLDHLVGRVRVNGDEWARASTDDMHFGWATVIAHASRHDGIVPGDVLVSGTLTGCSAIEHYDWADSGPLLMPGDVVEVEIDGLGLLRNAIGSPAESPTFASTGRAATEDHNEGGA